MPGSAREGRPLALSTMWSQQPRFANLADFAAKAKELGYTHVEISYVVREQGIDELRKSGIGVTSLHAPAPHVDVHGRRNFDLNLAALDEDERTQAVAHTKRTLDEAATLGARAIVVHLGGVLGDTVAAETKLKRLVSEEAPLGAVESAREALVRMRAEGQAAGFERAQRSLAELAEHALLRGVAIGLENRFHYYEFPNVDEALPLLAGYPPDVAGYWHDVGHAEVMDRLGLLPLRRWLDELGPRCIGAHLHDVDGIIDHRAPGGGSADWAYVAEGLPEGAIRTFEINQRVPEEAVAAAIPFLRERGVV